MKNRISDQNYFYIDLKATETDPYPHFSCKKFLINDMKCFIIYKEWLITYKECLIIDKEHLTTYKEYFINYLHCP